MRWRFGDPISPMKLFAFAAFLLLGACSREKSPRFLADQTIPSIPVTESFHVGDLNKDGRLNFWSIDAFDHIEPFVLQEEFGVVLYNGGSETQPVTHYILACQSTRNIINTADFSRFQEALSKIPKGTVVGRYDTCSVSRAYGLSEPVIIQFGEALTKAGLTIENRSVCYCPNRN